MFSFSPFILPFLTFIVLIHQECVSVYNLRFEMKCLAAVLVQLRVPDLHLTSNTEVFECAISNHPSTVCSNATGFLGDSDWRDTPVSQGHCVFSWL